jgi:hypothetical protein
MSYKYSTGSIRKGDIYYEDDREGEPTYIDFGMDTITLRPSGSAILHATAVNIGIGTTSPDEILTVNSAADGDECNIQLQEAGDDRAKIGINTSNNLVIHNQSANKHIVFKVNDAGTTREGFRINGAVPEVVVNEGSESLVDFRVESNNQTHMLFVDGGNNKIGIKTNQPELALDINDSAIRIRNSSTPSSAGDFGVPGEIRWDANYIYVCVSIDTWKRVALSSW